MREIPPPVFSRRSFLFFILLAPACVLAVAAIILTLQYKQYRLLVSPAPAVEAFAPTPATALRADSLLAETRAFVAATAADTLEFTPDDLNALAAVSPVLARQEIRVRLVGSDSLLTVESARRVNALTGRVAWIFKRIAPIPDGWLNARVEGLPELASRQLTLAPERGFLGGSKVPRAAITKRAGLSPKDFIDPQYEAEYAAFVAAVDTVFWNGRAVVLVRSGPESP
jgi:hypothetical protein